MADGVESESRSARFPSRHGKEIRPRKMAFDFGADIPRHWFWGSPFATHMANGINLLFPLGERFFVRAVRKFASHVDDPLLEQQVKGFIAQEVRHGMEHERFFQVLESQGYEVQTFLRIYERIAFQGLEKIFSDKMGLSVTVALEHFTATLAENALSRDFLAHAHPTMRDLLLWHASEEIEHKAVAFDVLKKVDDSYALRIAGLLMASATLVPFWFAAAIMFMRQDRDVPLSALLADRRRVKQVDQKGSGQLVAAFLEYLRPDFHPNDRDDAHLARSFFEQYAARRPSSSSPSAA
jgi:predicted metal-dependent hydrolase